MIYHIEILVEKLRDELKQYGELLALLDQQQELVLKRDADGIQSTAEQIDQQSMILESLIADRFVLQWIEYRRHHVSKPAPVVGPAGPVILHTA